MEAQQRDAPCLTCGTCPICGRRPVDRIDPPPFFPLPNGDYPRRPTTPWIRPPLTWTTTSTTDGNAALMNAQHGAIN